MHWPRIDLPKPPDPEIIPTLAMPRFFMSSKILAQAMRSVCGVLKTHFLTASMILTEPASEISGIPAFSTRGTIARVEPVVEAPTMMSTLSCSIRRLAKPTAFFGLPPES